MLRDNPVLLLSATNFHLDAIATDSIQSVYDDQEVSTTDFVLETACNLDLD